MENAGARKQEADRPIKKERRRKRKCGGAESMGTEYMSLAPVNEIPNGEEYLNALDWALKEPSVKNIALAGPYGAGKSSVIEAYLKRDYKLNSRKLNPLRISMATFAASKLANGKSGKIAIEPNEIEQGILKQLFYKVDFRKIPQSRYRKLHRVDLGKILRVLMTIVLFAFVVAFVFLPDSLVSIANKIIAAGSKFGLCWQASYILAVALLFVVVIGLAFVWRRFASHIKLKEIAIPQGAKLDTDSTEIDSVFNKNMDEIVYFFEETNYNVVFFEDLDRLDKPEIFVHLRELNTLLNNSDTIKRPIKFIYAIRDDIFSDADRTKFFEFIIPVIPVVNSTNSGDILKEMLRNEDGTTFRHDISEDYINDVSPYIEDMRILLNIYNEFVLFKRMLKVGQGLSLSDELMMSLVIFKNLYPKEYAELQMEEGIIKQAFQDKKEFIKKQKEAQQKKIDENTKALKGINQGPLASTGELKAAMLCALANWNGAAYKLSIGNSVTCFAEEIMEDDFDLTVLCKDGNWTVKYKTWNGGDASVSNPKVAAISEGYLERWKSLLIIEKGRVAEVQAEIEELKRAKNNIAKMSLEELISAYSAEEVLSKAVRSNELLVHLLRNGYIDERYVTYTTYFKDDSITKEDMNFILSIKNYKPLPFEHELTKIPQVIKRLKSEEFEQKFVYNFSLLYYMLSCNEYDDKLNIVMDQLADGAEQSWKFIDQFIDMLDEPARFVCMLSEKWPGMWKHIHDDPTLSYERKIYYFCLLCNYAGIDEIAAMNIDGVLKGFFEEHEDVLERMCSVESDNLEEFVNLAESDKLMDIIAELKPKFRKLSVQGVPKEILKSIFTNCYYQLNAEMIRNVVEFHAPSLVARLSKQNYTVITELGYEPLIDYVHENLSQYIKDIVLMEENTEENEGKIIDLLERSVDDPALCDQLICHEHFCLNKIADCCKDMVDSYNTAVHKIWDSLLIHKRVKPAWENVMEYWNAFGLTTELNTFIEAQIDELEKCDRNCVTDEFMEAFITADINSNLLERVIVGQHTNELSISLEDVAADHVVIMIKHHYFDFTVDSYEELNDAYPNLCAEFILENQQPFIDLIDDLTVDEDTIEQIVLSVQTPIEFKSLVIDRFGQESMPEAVAKVLVSSPAQIPIIKESFDAAWYVLDANGKEELMFRYLSLLDADDYEICFQDIGVPYTELADRSRRHEVTLPYTTKRWHLAKELKEVGYITSFDEKTHHVNILGGEEREYAREILYRVKAQKLIE